MGNYESLAILLLIALIVYIFDRKNFKREGIAFLRRTKRGLEIIDSIAKKYPRLITIFADTGIVFSFGLVGMRYLFIEKKTSTLKRIQLYALYLVIFAFIVNFLYGVFFYGTLVVLKISSPLLPGALFILVALTFLFGVSGYGFMTLFFGSLGIILASAQGQQIESSIKLVLPVEVPKDSNIPIFSVPIAEWLISILVILVVHEFSHAIVARVEGIKVKSIGYGFVGPMPLGFAEPDEKEIKASSSIKKTRIYGAGSFSNISIAIIIFIAYFFVLAAGVSSGAIAKQEHGVLIASVNSTMPAGVLPAFGVITRVDSSNITNVSDFVQAMGTKGPGDNVTLLVDDKEYKLTLVEDPKNKTRGILGVIVTENRKIGEMGFLLSLVNWIVLLNIGIGLANLFPLRPLDCGLMVEEILLGAGMRKKDRREETSKMISNMTLFLLLFSLIMPTLLKIFG